MLPLVLGLLIFFFLAIAFVLIFRYLDVKTRQEYRMLYDNEYYKKNVGTCPKGCKEGICQSTSCYDHSPPNPKCCAFDFQCKHCTTPSGQTFAEVYEDIKKSYNLNRNSDELKRLNDRIFKENIYIAKINKYIEEKKL